MGTSESPEEIGVSVQEDADELLMALPFLTRKFSSCPPSFSASSRLFLVGFRLYLDRKKLFVSLVHSEGLCLPGDRPPSHPVPKTTRICLSSFSLSLAYP